MHSKTFLSPPCSGDSKPNWTLIDRTDLLYYWEILLERVPPSWDQFLLGMVEPHQVFAVLRSSRGKTWSLWHFDRVGETFRAEALKTADSYRELRELVHPSFLSRLERGHTYEEDVVEEALREIHSSED